MTSLGSIRHVAKCNWLFTHKYPPLSIARYSFILWAPQTVWTCPRFSTTPLDWNLGCLNSEANASLTELLHSMERQAYCHSYIQKDTCKHKQKYRVTNRRIQCTYTKLHIYRDTENQSDSETNTHYMDRDWHRCSETYRQTETPTISDLTSLPAGRFLPFILKPCCSIFLASVILPHAAR